jgi:hypothetical protein
MDDSPEGSCIIARLAWAEVFAADELALVHVMNRSVPRCHLLGNDQRHRAPRKARGLFSSVSPSLVSDLPVRSRIALLFRRWASDSHRLQD